MAFQLLELYLGLLALIAVHEGGHALAIKWAGYRWYDCHIGPLRLRPQERSVRISFLATFLHGQVQFVRNPQTASFAKDCLILLAGIAANVLVGAVLSWIYFRLPSLEKNYEWLLPTLSLWSFLMAVGSLIPIRSIISGLESDGLQLVRLCYLQWRRRRT